MPLPDFATLQPVSSDGPDFATLTPVDSSFQKLNRTQLASDPRFQQEKVPLMTRIGAALYPMVEPLTPHGMLSQPNRLLGMQDPNTQYSPLQPFLEPTPESVKGEQVTQGIINAALAKMGHAPPMQAMQPPTHPGPIGGVLDAARQGVLGLTSLENIALAPAALESVPLRAILAAQAARQGAENVVTLPERARQAGAQPGASIGDLTRLVAGDVGELGLAAALTRSIAPSVPRGEGVKADRRLSDLPIVDPEVPTTQTGPLPGAPVGLLEQGGPRTRFQVDPKGEARKLYSGAAIDPSDLRPAVHLLGRLLVGEQGETHADILKRNGVDPELVPHEDPRRGFVAKGEFLNRQQAARVVGVPGTAKAGGLDSMDLPGAQQEGGQNTIRELRTSSISETSPSGNLQAMGEEVRPGTEAARPAQKETLFDEGQVRGASAFAKARMAGDDPRIMAEAERQEKRRAYEDTGNKLYSGAPWDPEKFDVSKVSWPHGMWLSPQGIIEDASPGHMESGGKKLNYDFQGRSSENFTDEDFDNVLGSMEKRGYVGLRGRSDGIEVIGGKLTSVQKAALERWGIEKEKSVWDFDGSVIYKPPGSVDLYSGAPPFDPSVFSSPERAKQAWEVFKKVVAKTDPQGAEKANFSEEAAKPTATRAKAIYTNPSASPLRGSKATIAQPGERLTLGDRLGNVAAHAANLAKETDKILNPWDVIFDSLDGGKGKFTGPLMEQIRKPLDDKYNDSANAYHAYADPIRDLAKEHKMGDIASGRIGVYLQAQQEGGVARMVESGIDKNVIQSILRTITPEELEVAKRMRTALDELLPQVQAVAKKADGIDVKPVANYFPWQREWRKYKPAADELATNPAAKSGDVGDVLWPGLPEARQRVIPGQVLERTPGAKTPIKVDSFSIFDRTLRDATHYIATREFLKDTAKIVRDDKFASTYGDMGQDLMMEFLNTFARQGRYKSNRILDALRRGTSRGVVGLRIPSQLVHLANIPLAMKHVGPMWWSKALDDVWTDEGQAFLKKNFAETFERGGGEPALRELEQTKYGQSSLMGKATTAAFAGQRYIDRTVTQAAVLGGYMKALAEKGKDPTAYAELPVDRDAVRQARVLARRAVASPIYKDVPPTLTRGGSLSKAFFQFQNTFLDQYSNMRYELAQVGVPEAFKGNPRLLAGMLFALATMLATETSIKYGYKEAKKKLAGSEKEDSNAYQKELLFEASRRLPGAGQLQSAVLYGETGIPAVDVALNIPKEVYKAVKGPETLDKVLHGTRAIGSALELGMPGASQLTDAATALEQRQMFKSHQKRLEEETGKSVEGMDLETRIEAERQHKAKQDKLSPETKAKAAGRAIENITKRGEEIVKTLPKADRQWLESRGLTTPGFDNKVTVSGQKVYLTKAEVERMAKYVQEEYVKEVMPALREDYDNYGPDETANRDKFFSEQMSAARARARARIIDELDSKNESNKPKKRFSAFDFLK